MTSVSDVPEPRRISSTLCWADASLPGSMTADQLDAVIFSKLQQNWLKTARVIGDVIEAYGSLPLAAEVVGARIHYLVGNRSIEARGNPRMWRHSELRLARTSSRS
jgi:uncharacterized protein DUF3658